jgi:polyisoprenoid-binding protein YceI
MNTNLSTEIQPGTYTVDPARSVCRFTATHAMGLKPVDGTMAIRSGTVTVAADPSRSMASAELDAATFRTDDARRDKDVTGKRFLDADRHPVIAFRSTGCRGSQIDGVLSVRGGACDVTLAIVGCESTMDGYRFTAMCVVDRVAAGVTAGRGIIGRRIRLTLDVCVVS